MKGAGAIETLGQARTVLFDKTGTDGRHTRGTRIVTRGAIEAAGVLRLAASLDRLSAHVLGDALVRAAAEADLRLSRPIEVCEYAGQGIQGKVDGHTVAVGSRTFIRAAGVGRRSWRRPQC